MTSNPQIVTASWFTKLPETHAPIGISRGVPRGRSGYRRYTALQPGAWFRSVGTEEFVKLYNAEILAPLDPQRVARELLELVAGHIPTLLCYEPPEPGPKWCHRGMVSQWLFDRMGLEVYELGFEHEGCGHSHPRLHPSYRKGAQPKP